MTYRKKRSQLEVSDIESGCKFLSVVAAFFKSTSIPITEVDVFRLRTSRSVWIAAIANELSGAFGIHSSNNLTTNEGQIRVKG